MIHDILLTRSFVIRHDLNVNIQIYESSGNAMDQIPGFQVLIQREIGSGQV